MLGSVAIWPISAVTVWSGGWLDGEGLENKVVAVSNLSEVYISGAVADRWADQGVHCKLRVGFVFRDGEFEIGNDASPSFAQTDRSLSKIHGVRHQSPFRLPQEIRMFDEGSERVEYSYRFVDEVERFLIIRPTCCMCMSMSPEFLK
jgi:hypothetical protein